MAATPRLVLLGTLSASLCLGQSGIEKHAQLASVTVHFAEHSAGFWARYVVTTRTTRQPGWIVPEGGEQEAEVAGIRAGAASRFKGIFYAPGCALQAVEISLTETKRYEYSFACEPVSEIELRGVVLRPHSLTERRMVIDAKYVAHWAPDFFGYDDGTDTEIPLGTIASLDDQNRFTMRIPDFGARRDGEIRIWLRDEAHGRIRDQLRVSLRSPEGLRTRLGGIPMAALQSTTLLFNVCSANSPSAHDKYGFALRDDRDGCEQ